MTPEESAEHIERVLNVYDGLFVDSAVEALKMGAAALRRLPELEARVKELEDDIYIYEEFYMKGF